MLPGGLRGRSGASSTPSRSGCGRPTETWWMFLARLRHRTTTIRTGGASGDAHPRRRSPHPRPGLVGPPRREPSVAQFTPGWVHVSQGGRPLPEALLWAPSTLMRETTVHSTRLSLKISPRLRLLRLPLLGHHSGRRRMATFPLRSRILPRWPPKICPGPLWWKISPCVWCPPPNAHPR